MAFVNKQGGDEQQDKVAAGAPLDFDPNDDTIVKVHYDLAAWSFDTRAELSEALADAALAHYWDGDELVVPEELEAEVDALFERLEAEFGPFPIGLDSDDESVEYGLDEWSDTDRSTLRAELVVAEIPHRWDGTTLNVVADAEADVDALLDSIEAGELGPLDGEVLEAPVGALSDLFLNADRLAKDPFDAKARRALIDLGDDLDPRHPPYALAPKVWSTAIGHLTAIIERFDADATLQKVDDVDVDERGRLAESSDVIGLAQSLRASLRDYV